MSKSLNINTNELWKAVVGDIEVKSPMIKTLASKSHLELVSENEMHIVCPDAFTRVGLESKYLDQIQNYVRNVTERDINVKTVIKKPTPKTQKENAEEQLGPLFESKKSRKELVREKQVQANLSLKFTFKNYIMGDNNTLAYAIATAIAKRPGSQYNPAFIYSGVGLGKTHLLQAVGNEIIRTKPGMRVVYTTGEQFTNELIESIQSGKAKGKYTSNKFRNKFRNADVFLIDDIQFIIGKEKTQEEFFHTFNTLYMAEKQIVITSDRPPKDFTKLEERITSRFASGIIADIQPPILEMRIAILRNLRDKNDDPVPDKVIDYIAERVQTNVRELEGAYMQAMTHAHALGVELTLERAGQALGQTIRDTPQKNINVNQILNAVCTYYSVKSAEVKGPRRKKHIVVPRQIAMYLIKEITGTPYITIGEFLGGRDHSTIMHGVEKIEDQMAERAKVRQDVANVKQIIYGD